MTEPKVSVIMPAFNRSKIIMDSIKSVLDQSYSDFELIVVDDGSTDNTFEIAGSVNDARVKCLRKENGGPASARNYGIKHAKGEYIAFIDSDDQWLVDHVETLIIILRQDKEVGLVYSALQVVNYDGSKMGVSGELFDKNKLERKCYISLSATILRRECIERVGLFDENPFLRQSHEDWEFFLRFSDVYKIIFVDKITGVRHLHAGSIILESLKNKNLFSGYEHLFQKRFEVYKKTPRASKVAPYDGYYFNIFSDIYYFVKYGDREKLFDGKDILRKYLLNLFIGLSDKDPENIEIWLLLSFLCFMLRDNDNFIKSVMQADRLLDQKIITDDKVVVELVILSLKNIISELEKAGKMQLASRFKEKMNEFS